MTKMLSMRMLRPIVSLLVLVVGLLVGVPTVRAQRARAVGPTPPRIAFIAGEASFWRPGAEDWAPAQVNTALAAGDSIYVGGNGNVEIEIGQRTFVRAGADTQIGLASLETGYLQLEMTSGHAAIDVKRLPEGQQIELDTPNAAFTIDRPGYYRAEVNDTTTFITRRGGEATVMPAGGETARVHDNEQVVIEGTDEATLSADPASDADEWDRWNFDRTARLAERPRSAEYVSPAVAGVDDLDSYGEWRDAPRYGHVWVPRDLPPDWAPYTTGRWVYDPYYGWTWVDDAPWGWAPYHYGRWCRVNDYWGWAPGPVIAAPVYAPALVAFFGGPHVSVRIGVGAPVVSWVALGWGEPVLPWWGPSGFVGRPYWGGWGGPRVVNNVVINNTKIVNVTTITRFQNVNVTNAVVAVDRDHFGRGRAADHLRVSPDKARELRIVRGRVDVKPVAASLGPRVERAQRPPDRIRNRPMVATRRPEDPTRRLRAAGISAPQPAHPVQPRIVRPTHPRDIAPGERVRMGGRGEHGNERPGTAERGANQPGVNQSERGANQPGMNQPGEAGHPGNVEGRGAPEQRGGRNVAPPPPGVERGRERGHENVEGGGVEPRGRGNLERDRNAVPPPSGGEGGGVEQRGHGNLERGRHAVPPPPGAEGAPTGEGGARERKSTTRERPAPPAPPAAERGRENVEGGGSEQRGRGNLERGRHAVPPPPGAEGAPAGEGGRGRDRRGMEKERVAPPVPPAGGESGAVHERGGGRERRGTDSGDTRAVPPPPAVERAPAVEHAPRERAARERPSAPERAPKVERAPAVEHAPAKERRPPEERGHGNVERNLPGPPPPPSSNELRNRTNDGGRAMQAPRNERPARQQKVERGAGHDAAPAPPPPHQHGANPKDREHQQPNQ